MTEITRLNQSWDAIATSSVITPEQYSSVVESFGLYYQKFLGYQGDDELIWWKEAVGGQFSLETAKQSVWSHPLAKTSLVGASGLAATLLVSFALSENAERQPTFTYRESPPPTSQSEASQDSASNTAAAALQAAAPSPPSVEFSGSRPSSLNPDAMPGVTVPRFSRPSAEAAQPEAPVELNDKSNEQGEKPSSASATSRNSAPQPAQAQPTQPQAAQPQEPLSTPGRLTPPPTSVANASRSPAMGVLERLPSLEEADPQQAQDTERSPGSPTVTHRAPSQSNAEAPTNQPSPGLGEALPLPQASPEVSPAASAGIPTPSTQQSRLSLENLPTLSNSEAAPSSPAATAPKPQASSETQPSEFDQSSSSTGNTNQFSVNRSVAFTGSNVVTPDVLTTSPVFGSTIQNLSRLFVPGLEHASETPYLNAQAPAAQTPAAEATNVPKVNESLNGIRDFLTFKQRQTGNAVALMPLTQQAAHEVQNSNQIDRFRIFQLTPAQYEIAWSAINGMTGTLPPTPAYGFIDYQRQMIVVPNVS